MVVAHNTRETDDMSITIWLPSRRITERSVTPLRVDLEASSAIMVAMASAGTGPSSLHMYRARELYLHALHAFMGRFFGRCLQHSKDRRSESNVKVFFCPTVPDIFL